MSPLPDRSQVDDYEECMDATISAEVDAGRDPERAVALAHDHCSSLFRADSAEWFGTLTREGWFSYEGGAVLKEFDNLRETICPRAVAPAFDRHLGERRLVGWAHGFRANEEEGTIDGFVHFLDGREPEGGAGLDVSIAFPDVWKERDDGTVVQELRGLDHVAVSVEGEWSGRCGPACRIYPTREAAREQHADTGGAGPRPRHGGSTSNPKNPTMDQYMNQDDNKGDAREGSAAPPETKGGAKPEPPRADSADGDDGAGEDVIRVRKEEFDSLRRDLREIKSHYDELKGEKKQEMRNEIIQQYNASEEAVDGLGYEELELVLKVLRTIPKPDESSSGKGGRSKDARPESIEQSIDAYEERLQRVRNEGGLN